MKRNFVILTITAMLVFSLAFIAACGNGNDNDTDVDEPPTIEDDQPDLTPPPDTDPTPDPIPDTDPVQEDPDYVPDSGQEPTASVPTNGPQGLVWSLSRDAAVQNLAQDDMGTGEALLGDTEFLQASGTPVLSVVPSPFGGNGLEVSFRVENSFALDIYTSALNMNLANHSYKIVVYGSVEDADGTEVIISGADAPQNWFIQGAPNEDGSFVLSGIFSQAAVDATSGGWQQFERCIRIQTNNLTNFTVYEIIILEVPVNHVWSLAFDPDVQAQNIGSSPFLQAAGSPVLSIIESPYGGNGISVSSRAESGFALDIVTPSLGLDVDRNDYMITISGSISGGTDTQIILGGADNPWNWFLNTVPNADGSFTLEGIISRQAWEATSGGSGQFAQGMRIQTNNTVDFNVYEISIVRAG